MTGGLILQVLISGVSAGAVFGLIGLGYTLIFRMTRVLNFAQGDLLNLAVFAFLLAAGGAVAATGLPVGTLVVAATVSLVLAAVSALALYRGAVAPFAARNQAIGWIAATAAAGLLARSLISMRFPAESYSFPEVLPVANLGRGGLLDLPGGAVLQVRVIVVLLIAAAIAGGLDLWLTRSRTGRAMRALSDEPQAAALVGIDGPRLRLLAWAIAGLLTCVAGLLIAPARPVSLGLGVVLGLKGTAAAVLGGLGSARGAIAAGLLLGVVEAVVTGLWIPAIHLGGVSLPQLGPAPQLHDILPLVLLLAVLIFLPHRTGAAEATPE